jgi:hypothetical protein
MSLYRGCTDIPTYLHVTDQMVLLYETFATHFALIAPAAKMRACNMNSQRRRSREALVAVMAAVRLLMRLYMCPKSVACEALPTHLTHGVLLLIGICMRLPVVIKAGAANKSLMAYQTLKRFVASVCPDMFLEIFLP